MATVKKATPKNTAANATPAKSPSLKKAGTPKAAILEKAKVPRGPAGGTVLFNPMISSTASRHNLAGIDKQKLVKLVLDRLSAEGKTVQEFARSIGMAPRVAESIFQGIMLPASHRVVQFMNYLGISGAEAPQIDAAQPRPKGNHIFISYSHRDTEYLERLLVHLKPLQRDGLIDAWVDTRLQAGDRWRKEIDIALKKARAAVLLVSADFLASDFVFKNELPPLLKAAEDSGTLIIPVVLKPCRFTRSKELRDFQAINPPDEPLSVLDESGRELIYDSIAQRIEAVFT